MYPSNENGGSVYPSMPSSGGGTSGGHCDQQETGAPPSHYNGYHMQPTGKILSIVINVTTQPVTGGPIPPNFALEKGLRLTYCLTKGIPFGQKLPYNRVL